MIELIKEIIEQDGLAQKNRKREIIHRKIYLFNALRKEGYTLKKIGGLFNMDHASILHGLKTYQNLTDVNDKQLRIDNEYYELLLNLQAPKRVEYNLKSEIKEAKNLVDLRKIQSKIKNNFY
jgi:hypothetical protein